MSHANYTARIRPKTHGWRTISVPTLSEVEIKDDYHPNEWYQDIGTSFDGTQVKYFDMVVQNDTALTGVYIDRLLFEGGLKIDPFQNPQYYPNYEPVKKSPASQDATSIANYGVRLYHHDNRDINSFARAQDEGDRVLAVLKDPVKTVTVVKKGYEWLRPNQTVTLNSSTLGISSETWRTVELQWEWEANYPVYCTARLVEQNAKVPPVFAPHGEVPAPSILPSLPWVHPRIIRH